MAMQRIPFPLETYEHISRPLSAKRLVNMMAEQAPNDARTAAALVPTPGLVKFRQCGTTGPIMALNTDLGGSIYAVAGTGAYRLSFPPRPNPGVEYLGEVGYPGRGYDIVTIAVSPTAAVICVPPNAFTCGHNGGGVPGADPLHQVGGDYPGAASVAYMDGYFAFSNYEDNAKWFVNRLWDPDSFDALDFVYADAVPNVILRIIARAGQLWVMGENGHEVWYDAGNANFPFARVPAGVITAGTSISGSIAQIDNSIWYLGNDGIVYRTVGYQQKRVSTHAIEDIIRSLAPRSFPVMGFGYKWRGHSLYSLRMGIDRTLTYNCATGAWHEQSSANDGNGSWRANSAGRYYTGQYMVGDALTSWIYLLEDSVSDDDYHPPRIATLPPIWAGTNRAFCSRLEIEMEVGTADAEGPIYLEWSDDGGTTWSPRRTMSVGSVGQLRKRVVTTRLGSFRQRVFRISSPKFPTLYAVDADITPAAS